MGLRQKLANNPAYIAASHASYRWMTRISPAWNSRRRWKKIFGFPLRLDAPRWWDEKLMWLKLNCYNDSPLVRQCANKYLARKYVAAKGCPELLIDCLGLWDRAEEIPWEQLPDRFVLKSTMGCGSHVFCRDKATLDLPAAKRTISAALKDRYYLDYSEMQYAPGRDMRPQVLCERLIDTDDGVMLSDYKFFCFHGEPKYILYCYERNAQGHANYMFLDMDWTPHPEYHPCNALDNPPPRPACLDDMIRYARILSEPFPFVRADFYEEKGQVRFGELTFTPSACLDAEITEQGQLALGALIDLNRVQPKQFLTMDCLK